MKAIRKYWAIAWITAKTNMAYASEVFSRLIFLGIILFIFMRLWQATYAHAASDRLAGLSLNQMLWYLALTESIVMSAPRISLQIDQEVRSGAVCTQLTRPMLYPLFRLSSYVGERGVRFLVTVGAATVIAFILVGAPQSGFSGLLSAFLTIPLAFVLDFLGSFMIGLGAFWMEDTWGLFIIYSRLTLILGGTLIPLQAFPQQWARILALLPFASIVNGPSRLVVQFRPEDFLNVLAHQAVWLVLFALLTAIVYRKALDRIAIHGG